MPTMQEKVLDAIRKRAEKAGLDFVQQASYSNTGLVFLQVGFDTVLSFAYDFQTATMSLQFYRGKDRPVMTCGFKERSCVLSVYCRFEEMAPKMKQVFDLVDGWERGQVESASPA